MQTQISGQQAEKKAVEHLQQQGLKLVCQNYHTRVGEIDIVMRDGDTWVCVEVKYRHSHHHGYAAEFVTPSKMKKMVKAFEQFLLHKGLNPTHTPLRIDVVALDGHQLQWLKNIY
ncbi:YraN family protein [Alteromonas pelagimontana]|uniref:UPF0102 protein CA267_004490 n=1 Tax=Alteromonas pelagimontana TaxID=1858656 RepID=A0A6M4MAM4_9ALTE|nr:YraN family protein [Alteromonas pelagimontana]QJR80087.1 YraN family protein [Alteromonas pelagimontana]